MLVDSTKNGKKCSVQGWGEEGWKGSMEREGAEGRERKGIGGGGGGQSSSCN